jgi:hypothetical protein
MLGRGNQNFWVIENFYEEPDKIREMALLKEYRQNIKFYKGFRSTTPFRPEIIKLKFEEVIGQKILKWDHNANGVFQYTTPEDPLVYHTDSQSHAAVVYLNPNAPYECGTEFLASDAPNPFKWGFLDRTKFSPVDAVGNVYNRAIIFRGSQIHAACRYFGTELEDSRLVHLFFFDCEG